MNERFLLTHGIQGSVHDRWASYAWMEITVHECVETVVEVLKMCDYGCLSLSGTSMDLSYSTAKG